MKGENMNEKLKRVLYWIMGISAAIFIFSGIGYRLTYKVNINTAEETVLREKLESLYDVGEILSERIIEGRPYQSFDELEEQIKGIGDVRIKELQKRFKIK